VNEQVSKEKLYYLGKFGETLSETETEMIKDAEMFSTGVHRGVEFTEDDLQELVDNFNAEDEIPVQLDHSESARDTVGYLQEVSLKDGKLNGKLKIVDEWAQGRVKQGLMKKLSVAFYLKYTENGFKPHKLREVSLVAFPQVKGAQLFSENGYVSNYEEPKQKEVKEMNLTPEQIAAFKEELRKEVETEVHDDFSELKGKADQLDQLQMKFKEKEVEGKIEKFSADSKIVPAQKEALQKLMVSFSDEQAALFETFMASSAKADFSEQGEFQEEDGEQGEKDSRTPEQIEFDKFYEEHTKQFGAGL
jgi:hypothetical protein